MVLAIFFALTIAMTWACWMPVVLADAVSPALSWLWLLGVFAPALVAIAVTGRVEGSEGVRALLRQALKWRVKARWYGFAVGYIAVIKLSVAVIERLFTGAWPPFGHEGPVVLLVATLLSAPVQIGEELGWRGFALPRLADRMGLRAASLVLGVIWAGWHLPQFALRTADTYHQSFPIWSFEVIGISVAMAWLYGKTGGSVLLTMLMHAAVNNIKDIVPSAAEPGGTFSWHGSLTMDLTAGLMAVMAVALLVRMPDLVRTGSPTPSKEASLLPVP